MNAWHVVSAAIVVVYAVLAFAMLRRSERRLREHEARLDAIYDIKREEE